MKGLGGGLVKKARSTEGTATLCLSSRIGDGEYKHKGRGRRRWMVLEREARAFKMEI